jgi:hypothetical protein
MSEAVEVVKEFVRGAAGGAMTSSMLGRARSAPCACGACGARAVKAGRKAARRGSIDGLVVTGFQTARPSRLRLGGGVIEDALRCCLQFPTRVWGASEPGSVAWTCLRRSRGVGPSMERCGAASSAQSHIDDCGGHADTRAGLLAASERAHPSTGCARQRISPSRNP